MFVNLFLCFRNSTNRVFFVVCKGVLLRTDDNSAELKPCAVINKKCGTSALFAIQLNSVILCHKRIISIAKF